MTISDVSFDGSRYIVFDEGCQEVKTFWDSEGTLVGFGQDFLIFDRDDRYRFVRAEGGDEITSVWRNSVGQFKHVNGRLVVFKTDSKLVVHEVGYSGVSEISNRWA